MRPHSGIMRANFPKTTGEGGAGARAPTGLILRSAHARVSKDGSNGDSWFETREDTLLTMRSSV
jgi:hypothetical protein